MPPSEMFDAALAVALPGVSVLLQIAIVALLWLAFAVWVLVRLTLYATILYVGHKFIMLWARAFVASWRPRPSYR